ncbi:hypothetical protein BB558_004999 [Smittium angustum]|uniref:Serine/threonine-protein phosphatase n=1 Tax=Smittium angustum TaxID=133377 RepID=A0A2U1J1T0_SMIAN|nr:hypothetical protein BB558_004999 [Smittium angustum]
MSNPNAEQLKNQVRKELAMANAQELINSINEHCFKMCIQKPGSKIDSSEESCLDRCMDKYMAAWDLVSRSYDINLLIQQADEIKTAANALFAQKKYDDAIEQYTNAIELNPNAPAYYSNRAQCYILTERYGAAITDADKAVELDPAFFKGYYRRAVAYMAMGKIEEARRDYKKVSALRPSDKAARANMLRVDKLYKKIMFEKAIETDVDIRLISEKLNVDDYKLDDSYNGPIMKIAEVSESDPNSLLNTNKKNITDNEEKIVVKPILETVDLKFVEELSDWFKNQQKLPVRYVYAILISIQRMLRTLGSLVDIDIPKDTILNICGDVHGQYYDVLNLFKLAGKPSEKNMFLFNGDFVDRGSFSVETVFLLFVYKLLYPNTFFLNRGNHETISMNKLYGFEGEILSKYGNSHGARIFNLFQETFNCLPIAHLVKNKIFVVHGGLYSQDLGMNDKKTGKFGVTLDMIRNIDRFRQPGDSGILVESLWSDPQKEKGRSPNKRGVAIQFGPDVTKQFLELNDLKMVVRSHEKKDAGYEIEHDGQCVTVFSAPNYCDQVGNLGAYMRVNSDLDIVYKTFEAVEHPPVKSMAYANISPFM